MVSILVEILCPEHGLERFRVKIIRKFNMASNQIIPKLRKKRKANEIRYLYIGRNVSYSEAERYLVNYFHENRVGEILRIRMLL